MAGVTENADGAVSRLFSVVLGAQLLLALALVLGLERVKDLKDLSALLDRFQNSVGVSARAVQVCLIAAIQLNAEGLNPLEKFLFKVLCIVFVAAPGVGNIHVRAADIFVVAVANHSLHVCRDLAATVVFIPRDQQL